MQDRLIEPFQRGETPTFTEHVRTGIELLARDAEALLVFSGGATKAARTLLTEAESYHNLAKDNDFFGLTIPQRDARIVAESHATDSFQNVLFSLLRFRLHTGFYPERISVVTHDFKRRRFMECHFPSLGLVPAAPRQQHRSEHACRGLHASGADSTNASKTGKMVQVIGIDPPEIVTARETLLAGEEQNGFGLWVHDWYGCGPALARKRLGRGWKTGLEESLFVNVGLEPLVEDLVCWRGGRNGNEQFPGLAQLPWACADITLTGSFAAATTKGHNG